MDGIRCDRRCGFVRQTGLGLAVEGLVEVWRIAFNEALAADGMLGIVFVDASSAENGAVNAPSIALVRNEESPGLPRKGNVSCS